MVRGWTVVDDRTLIVTDRLNRPFKVTLMPGCLDLRFHLRLSFRSFRSFRSFSGLGISCIRRGDALLVPPQAGRRAQRCRIADAVALGSQPRN